MSRVVAVLAAQAARKAVKRQIAAQGRKPQWMPAAEIGAMAEEWLRSHPQLFAETVQRVQASPELRLLLDKELAKRGKEIALPLAGVYGSETRE